MIEKFQHIIYKYIEGYILTYGAEVTYDSHSCRVHCFVVKIAQVSHGSVAETNMMSPNVAQCYSIEARLCSASCKMACTLIRYAVSFPIRIFVF